MKNTTTPVSHSPPDNAQLAQIQSRWAMIWPQALGVWSRFTRLREPCWCLDKKQAHQQGLDDSFAMIRLHDQSIVVSLSEVARLNLQDFALEILAHEIGHHILAPANLTDHARCLAIMRAALPTLEAHAPMIANLYTDLLINNHLQRSAGLRMADLYQRLPAPATPSNLWLLYLRIYEILWQLAPGDLCRTTLPDTMEGDAWLGSRLISVYARDWLAGAGGFAALVLPYLLEDRQPAGFAALMDTEKAGMGETPGGLVDRADEENSVTHPALDPRINDKLTNKKKTTAHNPTSTVTGKANKPSSGQTREPFEYGELLRATGLDLSDHEIAVRYYRERARPHLVRFPRRRSPSVYDPVPEGTQLWEAGEPLENIDWFQTLQWSPVAIPGVTTQQRVWGQEPGNSPQHRPLNLDLYVDCSGSMPNPQQRTSYTTLAGAILCLSALRAGAQVQVTLWSGKHQYTTTPGFVRDDRQILGVLCGYFGGGTAFPLHVLRDTYQHKPTHPVHIVILSDDGVTTLLNKDEKGQEGWDIAQNALQQARGGGSMVLNLPWTLSQLDTARRRQSHDMHWLQRARDKQGWQIYRVAAWQDMLEFARDFSRRHYDSGEDHHAS